MLRKPQNIADVVSSLKLLSSLAYTIRDAIIAKDLQHDDLELVCIEEITNELAHSIYAYAEYLEHMQQPTSNGGAA